MVFRMIDAYFSGVEDRKFTPNTGAPPQMRTPAAQLPLLAAEIIHPHAVELAKISEILDANPRMAKLVAQDLLKGLRKPHTGARGLTGDQVLRILLVKQMNQFSYDELEFHLADSLTYRSFCRLPAFAPAPKRATLAENLKKLRARTMAKINRRLVRYAVDLGVETGDKCRTDATVSETNIHAPTDSSLLYDGVQVLSRLLGRAREEFCYRSWSDHTKRAKRRSLAVLNARGAEERERAYRDLLKVTRMCAGYAEPAAAHLKRTRGPDRPAALALAAELEQMVLLVWGVIHQTEQRVLRGESVPSDQKIVSLFEPHTDIIVKDRRATLYGHKVYLSAGASGIITDCFIAEGNPADSDMAIPMLRRHARIVGKVPEQAALDGGFASRENLERGKALGIQDLAFSKRRGITISEMTRSDRVYRLLRDFRAGIEGLISFLKRVFGLRRCTWRGAESFGTYVTGSVIAANALTLARHLLA
jgi:transposase, IS5 family